MDAPRLEQPNKPVTEAGEAKRSLPGNITELAHDTIELVRKELELAKAEMGEQLAQVRQGIGSIATRAMLFAGGLLTLLAAAVIGIGLFIPYWVSALIVGGVVTLIGGAMLGWGRQEVEPEQLKPERTVEELEHDRRLIREHA